MILYLLRMRRNVKRTVYNDLKNVSSTTLRDNSGEGWRKNSSIPLDWPRLPRLREVAALFNPSTLNEMWILYMCSRS